VDTAIIRYIMKAITQCRAYALLEAIDFISSNKTILFKKRPPSVEYTFCCYGGLKLYNIKKIDHQRLQRNNNNQCNCSLQFVCFICQNSGDSNNGRNQDATDEDCPQPGRSELLRFAEYNRSVNYRFTVTHSRIFQSLYQQCDRPSTTILASEAKALVYAR